MNASSSRYALILLAGLTLFTTGCSAAGRASSGPTPTAGASTSASTPACASSASQIGSGAQQATTWPADPQLLAPGRTAQATLRFVRTGNFTSPQCQHVNVLFIRVVPPGNAAAALAAGVDEQVCAQATLPTMTITTVIPDT